MEYTGITYRPPFEANSLLLHVTQGCSHNQCSFCTMYRNVPFAIESMEQIESDLQEAEYDTPDVKRVFLENGDPFVLSATKLMTIAEMIHAYLPEVETIAMYASIKNIQSKTDEELCKLRDLGINDLNIGVESGLDDALSIMKKGYSAEEAIRQLKRLNKVGIEYGANIIFGCAGKEKWRENAEATAQLLNATNPYLIFTGTIHADPGCPLYDMLQEGSFEENTFEEYLDEETLFLSQLDLPGCLYFGLHPSNIVRMYGYLNRDKDLLLNEIDRKKRSLGKKLSEKPRRSDEGAILL